MTPKPKRKLYEHSDRLNKGAREMYIRAKIELIADKDAGTFFADNGEWVLQYPVPTSILRALARWLTYRINVIEGPEPEPSFIFPAGGSVAIGHVEPQK